MGYQVDNAVIMAAGTASRFAPLSYECHKALIEVKGEVLIERQIRQLREAGVPEIIVVTGYKQEQFAYLKDKLGVTLVHNADYLSRNNNGSIYAAKDYIRNSYICSSDNYFSKNPFEREVEDSYYAAIYADGETKEWCMTEDAQGYIDSVTIGGKNAWFMLGHTFWSEEFSRVFLDILEKGYHQPENINKLWESLYMENLDILKMRIRKYDSDVIFEFDTLDELREFDESYRNNTRSKILKQLAQQLGCREEQIVDVIAYKDQDNAAAGMRFRVGDAHYQYPYATGELKTL